jgi:hypothetical protein
MRQVSTNAECETDPECPLCTFLNGDVSITFGWSSACLALDSSWQSADVDLFLALTDEPMITLLGPHAEDDLAWLQLLEHRAFSRPLHNAVKCRLTVDGYVAGRILLRTAGNKLRWPTGSASERWREAILAHRTHDRAAQFRSTGAWLHVHRVTAQSGVVNDKAVVASALATFRAAFADAMAEGLLAHHELSDSDGPFH